MSLKQRNIIVLIGFLLLLLVCYKIPIAQMLNAKKEYNKLEQESNLFSNIPQKISSLNKEKVYLDSILSKYQFSADKSFQSNLLETIASFSEQHSLKVITFDEPHSHFKNETTLNTFSFSVRGTYNNILGLIHELEQIKKLGKVLSINFEKKKNYRTNISYLEAIILLQRIEN